MLFRQRRVRRSKFTSRMRTGSRQRQEYAASVYSMVVIQGLLTLALFLGAFRSYQAIVVHSSDLPVAMKLALPVFFVVVGLISARSCWTNVRTAREIWAQRSDRGRRQD